MFEVSAKIASLAQLTRVNYLTIWEASREGIPIRDAAGGTAGRVRSSPSSRQRPERAHRAGAVHGVPLPGAPGRLRRPADRRLPRRRRLVSRGRTDRPPAARRRDLRHGGRGAGLSERLSIRLRTMSERGCRNHPFSPRGRSGCVSARGSAALDFSGNPGLQRFRSGSFGDARRPERPDGGCDGRRRPLAG
jgi:hypothetical protein